MKLCRHNTNGWCDIRAMSPGHSRVDVCATCSLGLNVVEVKHDNQGNKGENEMKVSQIKSKVAAKVAKGKAKVAAKTSKIDGKVAKGKARVAKWCGAVALVSCLASLVIGCQNPAQRAQTCEVRVYAYDASTVTLGADSVSLAQSNETGGNDAGQTASPTTDLKPEVAVGVGGSSAGVGSSGAAKSGVGAAIGAAVDAAAGLFNGEGDGGKAETVTPTTMGPKPDSGSDTPCADGNCSDCADGSCSD